MSKLKFTIILMIVLIVLSYSCHEKPLKAGDVNDIAVLIRQAQKRYIRESYGEWAYQCFTDVDYQIFLIENRPQNIVSEIKGNRKFKEAIIALRNLPEEEQSRFIQSLRKPLRPTWSQLGRISKEGQTEAGQRAEMDIADAVADTVLELSKLSTEELFRAFGQTPIESYP